jgi:hypothetical protein
MRSRLFPILLLIVLMVSSLALAQSSAAPQPATETANKATPGKPANTPPLNNAAPGRNDGVYEPYLDIPPLPKGKVTLIGGVVQSIDPIRNRMTVDAFGGQKVKVRFDDRTHIYRDAVETTQLGIKKGDRVYVDTMLDRSYIFARNIHVQTGAQQVDTRGQVLRYEPESGLIVIQDTLTSQPVRFRVDNTTAIRRQSEAGARSDLRTGALIAVRFSPDHRNRGLAREVSILAMPGASFVFAGEITYLNLASGILAVRNTSDGKTYEIHFNPTLRGRDDLKVGSQVTVTATFSGRGYEAQQVSMTGASGGS